MSRMYVQSEGTAARRRFPVYLVDATDGITPETGEASGQPQISKVGGAWSNTTATLTAIGNGAYYVELTATELDTLGSFQIRFKSANTAEFNMDGQVVAINVNDSVRAGLTALPNAAAEASGGLITRGTSTGQLSVSGGRANADVTHWSTVAVGTPDSTGYPKVTIKSGTGTGELSITSGVVSANAVQLSGDATAADNAESFFDGTGYAGTNNVIPTVTTVTNAVSANVTQISGDSVAADRLEAALDGTGGVTISANIDGNLDGNITGNVQGDVEGDLEGNVFGVVGGLDPTYASTFLVQVNAQVVDALATDTYAEPSSVPAATSSIKDKLNWLFALARNKITQTETTQTLRNDADSGNVATATHSDDGTTYTRGEWS